MAPATWAKRQTALSSQCLKSKFPNCQVLKKMESLHEVQQTNLETCENADV